MLNSASSDPFASSQYYHLVGVDFEELPNDIVLQGICYFFEPRTFNGYSDVSEWRDRWLHYIDKIPQKYRHRLVAKAVEYATKSLEFHSNNECMPYFSDEELHSRWQRRIDYAEEELEEYSQAARITYSAQEEQSEYPKEFTTARQVLAVHYLLEYCKVSGVDNTVKARFIQFLTGREFGAKDIRNTSIYKKVREPFSTDEKTLTGDLRFVRTYFENLGLSEIVRMITNELSQSGL